MTTPAWLARRLAAALAVAMAAVTAVFPAAADDGPASHETTPFVVTPDSGTTAADVGVAADGSCDVNTTFCGIETGSTAYDPALHYAACGVGTQPACPAAGAVDQVVCTVSSTALSDAVLTNAGQRERIGSRQVVTATGTMPTAGAPLAPGRYVVCHEYKPKVMWDIFTVLG